MKNICIFVLLIMSTTSFGSIKELGFEFVENSNKDGVIVYKSITKNKKGVLPIKAHTILKSTFSKVKYFLDNFNRMKSWVPDLVEIKILPTKNKNSVIQYLRYNAPWPFSDRTFLLQMDTYFDKKKKVIKYQVHSVVNTQFPLDSKFVRGHTEIGYVKAESISDQETKVSLFIYSDLKGFIPKWIMGYVQLSWPNTMFKNLKDSLREPQLKSI